MRGTPPWLTGEVPDMFRTCRAPPIQAATAALPCRFVDTQAIWERCLVCIRACKMGPMIPSRSGGDTLTGMPLVGTQRVLDATT